MGLLNFPSKRIRAEYLKDYILNNTDYKRCVCFTCGHCAYELRQVGLETLSIGKNQDFEPTRWYSKDEISHIFTDYFDATSGHLSYKLMIDIGQRYKEYLGELDPIVYVPCGSGETIVSLALVYPKIKFIAVYDDSCIATEYNENAPLNPLVEKLAYKIIKL